MIFSNLLKALALSAASLIPFVAAETVTYDFNVTWVNRNPDGQHERRVQGINGQWPIPTINVNVGDRLVVNLYNALGDRDTSLHWHGLFQNGTNDMDGPGQVTQCPVGPGQSFTYNFTIDQPGTYWYHSHVDGAYPDGLRGPLIVHDPENPYKDQYDEELVVSLSDWYHDETPGLIEGFISVSNPTGAEPVPNAALMNETQNLQISVVPGKTYFLRIVNVAAFAPQYFWIEGHTMRIIEVDGVYHEPANASMIYVATAQRYGVLLTARNDTDANYAIVGSMDTDLFDSVPDTLNPNVTGWLVYDQAKTLPVPANVTKFDPFDDMALVPTDKLALFEDPVMSISVDVIMDNLGNGANYAFFNNITYVRPVVPTLYTVMNAGDLATNPSIYGSATHSFVLNHNEVYEMVVNNHDTGKHPFHLHGHNFQALVRSNADAGDWDPESVKNGSLTFPATPMRRDTIVLQPTGHFVIRFRSDNPGVWLFHCHIEWHVSSGLILTLIEAPLELQQSLQIPPSNLDACKARTPPMPTTGNAAGNTVNYLDLAGENLPPAPLPAGFTPRGIVALVFSAIAGLLGVAVIAWYGTAEMGSVEKENIRERVEAVSGVANGHAVDGASVGGVEGSGVQGVSEVR